MSAQSEGPECQMAHTAKMELREDKTPNYNLVFHNKDGDEVGRLDFNGPGLAFEGIADMSAITFMDWISQVFIGRLKEERNKERKALEAELLKLRQGVAANSEYIQARWDLIGEFQDIILERIEK